jgi:hypothetical protein
LSATVENIPDEDSVSRLVDYPHGFGDDRTLIWQNVFQFPDGQGESVIWRKYASSSNDVHLIGFKREMLKQQKSPQMRYEGFLTGKVKCIREIQTKNGHRFEVIHAPCEGQAHAEIRYAPSPSAKLTKPEKAELKLALQSCFGQLPLEARPAS